MKENTSETIEILNECDIRSLMATGDNMLTAIAVALQCKILNKESNVYICDVVNDQI